MPVGSPRGGTGGNGERRRTPPAGRGGLPPGTGGAPARLRGLGWRDALRGIFWVKYACKTWGEVVRWNLLGVVQILLTKESNNCNLSTQDFGTKGVINRDIVYVTGG